MHALSALLFSLALIAAEPNTARWRADLAPRTKEGEINEGLPYRWEAGKVYLLAWETVADQYEDESHERVERTQILVLKRYDEPTEKGGYRWVLAQLFHRPKEQGRPWEREMLHIPPYPKGERRPPLSDATVFGHEFYKELPTDQEILKLLREAHWHPELGKHEAFTFSDDKVVRLPYATWVVSGGVDRELWKKLFGREVPAEAFPELKN